MLEYLNNTGYRRFDMGTLVLCFLIIYAIIIISKYRRFNNSSYKSASGNGFFKTIFDKGNYGEFLTFAYLEKLDGKNKLMTNLYIPKSDGTTTELDLMMISQTGIYVFESKNYSGWIFGNEKDKNWTQMLQNKQKNRFFNPIWQNNGHINALKRAIEIDDSSLYKSYIIFSERCELKKITVASPNIKVLKRNVLIRTIKEDINTSEKRLTDQEIDKLFLKLQKYACVDELVKKAHIENIQKKLS